MSNGCSSTEYWNQGCQCCMPKNQKERLQTLYELTSQVNYVAIRRVYAGNSEKVMSEQLDNSIRIMTNTLAELTNELPHGYHGAVEVAAHK